MNAPLSRDGRGVDALERRVEFSPAYDKRSDEPGKNYGIGAVVLRMYVIGPDGAVQFVAHTDWHLPHVDAHLRRNFPQHPRGEVMAADLGYHSKVPQYDGQEVMKECCDLLGCACYYDGSGLNAEPILDVLLREGSDGVWRELERYYAETFAPTGEAK